MLSDVEKIRNLIDELNHLTKAYDQGKPEVSDKEWDNKYFELSTLEKETGLIYPDSPTQSISYELVNSLQKINHNHKMLSLDKTKDLIEVDKFLNNKNFVAMAKMDGLTCSLKYSNGKLISGETRGDGIIGEDITHNVKVIKSIPLNIEYKQDLIIDGELVCLDEDFTAFSKEYKNSRNFASGSARLLDAKECANRNLTFIAWNMIEGYDDINSFTKRLEILNDLGFCVVPWIQEHPIYAVHDIQEICSKYGYPIDGVVFKFDDVKYGKSLGETAHHFKNAIAFKFYDEEYETKLTNIEWSMGRTGQITPVAIFEPVDIDGSSVSRASLHNINILHEIFGEYPYIGQQIKVTKKNMIIPQVTWADPEGITKDFQLALLIPKICPVCGQPTQIVESETGTQELYCTNDLCSGKFINRLDHFLGKKGLDIKGISLATLEKLVDWGWVNEIKDIFFLGSHVTEWCNKPGFGDRSVSKLLEAIAAGKQTTLEKFICAIGIPSIGTSTSKQLALYFQTWENFREAVDTGFNFTQLPDVGELTAQVIQNFDYTEADQLFKILTVNSCEKSKTTNEKLVDKKIVITGTLTHFKNRGELQSLIENAGGKVVSSVTKNTFLLINNNVNSTSAKNMAAKKLGIPILSEEEFLEAYI